MDIYKRGYLQMNQHYKVCINVNCDCCSGLVFHIDIYLCSYLPCSSSSSSSSSLLLVVGSLYVMLWTSYFVVPMALWSGANTNSSSSSSSHLVMGSLRQTQFSSSQFCHGLQPSLICLCIVVWSARSLPVLSRIFSNFRFPVSLYYKYVFPWCFIEHLL